MVSSLKQGTIEVNVNLNDNSESLVASIIETETRNVTVKRNLGRQTGPKIKSIANNGARRNLK